MRFRTAVSCGSLLAEARRPFLPPASAARNSSPSGPRDNTSPSHSTSFYSNERQTTKTKTKKGTTMNPLTQFKKILILPLLIALSLVALASPPVARANEATHWNQIATDTLAAFPPAAGGAPNALQVNMGMTQGSVYDAINAIEPRHRPYLLATRFNANASKEAAAATAAYSVLSNIVSTM